MINNTFFMGYYFSDSDFDNLLFMSPTEGNILSYSKDIVEDLFNKNSTFIQSIRWLGKIKVDIDGIYEFLINPDTLIELDKTILNSTSNKLKLKKDIFYNIRIEQKLENKTLLKDFVPKMFQINLLSNSNFKTSNKHQIYSPNFSKTDEITFIPNESLFGSKLKIEVKKDTDNDNIQDDWELNGYTIKDKVAAKWKDEYANLGYKKFVSNPFNSHTANDPYTDYEKAAMDYDQSILQVAQDPMVAAYPVVGVKMEKLILSKNQISSTEQGKTISRATSNSSTSSITSSISTNIGFNPEGISGGVTTEFSNTHETSNTVTNETGETWSEGLQINIGESAYLNANIRYYNSGSAPIYDVQPTTNLVLDNDTINTILAGPNQLANVLQADKVYPAPNLNPIAMNTMDPSNSLFIHVNYDQLKKLDNGIKLSLETTQVKGNFLTRNNQGESTTEGNDWKNYMSQIENTCALLILDNKGEVFERYVAAPNSSNPEDKTPQLTLREALIKAFSLEERENKLYYKDIPFNEDDILLVYDELTKNEIEKQIAGLDKKEIYNIKINPKMKILAKIPVYICDFDKYNKVWANVNIIDDPSRGKVACISKNTTVANTIISTLEPKKSYMLNMYIKGQNKNKVSFAVQSEKPLEVELTENYRQISIPFKTLIGKDVYININNLSKNGDIYFDNVIITEIDEFDPSREDIKKKNGDIYSFYKDNSSYLYRCDFNIPFLKYFPQIGLRAFVNGIYKDLGLRLRNHDGYKTIITPADYTNSPVQIDQFEVYVIDQYGDPLTLFTSKDTIVLEYPF
ncbi:ADP-ribosylating binary toxin binding subunit BecB [Clostridium perfringens]|uniref:Binary enterotoxin of Clostridium perfringens component b n=1 Tax=Clostridium perfringens TaxID=1502 RepID=X5HZK7_CLOPF|nr:ADP-ribosylating binary toxin binding subunit BecB [Clostridium perfringens]EHK2364642.1 iota toxin protein Ib [Clostridium perfringens]EJT5928895.1 iota toxin protein Ib [Clostridium perfringens]EJT6172309.1 iota toxin protein Ib [Clostridium perfringens]EJT6342320.1 iota toxin protein Ib [Clostridium perfringens]EJT6483477.1 iota toxin protein Ib [Clostridium perfringens]